MPTTFEFVREQLITAGRKGVSQADLFIAVRQSPDVRRNKGTYSSFNKMFHTLVRLGFVERMKKTEKSTTKYGLLKDVLSDRTFYRITDDGKEAAESVWINPYVANYPDYEDKSKYYTPTGRARGRPRAERRQRRARAPRERRPIAEVPEVLPEPVRERRRRLRIPVSRQIESELPALRESIEALRASKDLSQADTVEATMLRLFDRAIDAVEGASGEERERLRSLVVRLETSPEGFDDVRAGIMRRNEVTFQRGIETLLLCCPE